MYENKRNENHLNIFFYEKPKLKGLRENTILFCFENIERKMLLVFILCHCDSV